MVTEGELNEIITEAVKKLLTESKLAVDIDITKIPIEILRRGYFDYRLVPQTAMYGNALHQPNTVKEAVGDIMRDGLIPNHKNYVFNYPPRTYLMQGDATDEQMWGLGQQLCIANRNPKNDGTYNVIIVDVKDIDEGIRFFYDHNSEIGIFTEQTIQRERIKVAQTVKFINNLKGDG